MAVTPDDVRSIAPEFSDKTDPEIQPFIDDATLLVTAECFGSEAVACMAIKYLTAHLLSQSEKGSIGGDVTSKKVGDISINYSSSSKSGGAGGTFSSTSYGQTYEKLRRSRVLTMRVLC